MRHNLEGERSFARSCSWGKALSIETFAEGIEQQQELSLLRSEDCDSGQGFLFARPLDSSATEAFLQVHRAANVAPADATSADAVPGAGALRGTPRYTDAAPRHRHATPARYSHFVAMRSL